MSNQPVYRRPRSHADWCRCTLCAPEGDFVARNGIVGPGFLILCAVVLVGFWPVLAWHGYTGNGGWRWDIHSTYAELAYLGVIAFIIGLIWLGNRPAKPAGPPLRYVPPSPPSGPDPAVTARLLLDLDAADGYMDEIDRAWSAEVLGYLQRNGRLPDGWPFRDSHREG